MTPNIVLQENEAFGHPNYGVIRALLFMVDMNMMTALERPPFSSQNCQVLYKEEYPRCAKYGDQHIIFLSVKDDYWCQWVYQFAHEYCHHLINGTLSGVWSQNSWFEETLCEVSSLYNLQKMIGFCETHGLQVYAPSVQDYLSKQLSKNANVYSLSEEGGWYQRYAKVLSIEEYKRDLYNAIAVLMLPLFLENPSLWKILLKIGDISSWGSLEALLEHLLTKADDSYLESLIKMQKVFS